ncbi:MAG TPA: dihydrofolate reductase, partial [Thermoanaerobaculia bacterium]|nr:dihydrofolate reductase [Thermoanaerobaculia bacterium]
MISIVAAMSENRAIGRNLDLPWKRLSADLKRFKSLTLGHHLIMGRRTWDSVGKPLPGRINVVVTHNPATSYPTEVKVATSLQEAIGMAAGDGEIFIGGGSEIFRQSLPLVDRMYLTIVHATLDGD